EAASGVYNELQVGSYVFMDTEYARIRGGDGRPYAEFEHSLFVLCRLSACRRRTEQSWMQASSPTAPSTAPRGCMIASTSEWPASRTSTVNARSGHTRGPCRSAKRSGSSPDIATRQSICMIGMSVSATGVWRRCGRSTPAVRASKYLTWEGAYHEQRRERWQT